MHQKARSGLDNNLGLSKLAATMTGGNGLGGMQNDIKILSWNQQGFLDVDGDQETGFLACEWGSDNQSGRAVENSLILRSKSPVELQSCLF